MSSPCKVLFVAFDGAEMDLLLSWADTGELSNVRRLRDSAAWGRTEPPAGFGNDSMWFSLSSGVNPGRHGHYFPFQVFPGTYDHRRFTNADVKREPFWLQLGRDGKRVAIVDIPFAPYRGDVNGVQVLDWLVHEPLQDRRRSSPPGLIDELIAEFGEDRIHNCNYFKGETDRCAELRSLLLQRIEAKLGGVQMVLDQGGWDLLMTSFTESHCVGHQCWHLHDTSHPAHDARWVERHGDPLRDVYRALDAALGQLLDRAGPDTYVFFLAGPGMQGNYGANYLLDQILRHLQAGPAKPKDSRVDRLQKVWRKLPMGVRRFASPLSRGFLTSERGKRKYFAVPHNEVTGAIRVNLAGREPHGFVQPGAEYDSVCAQLTEDLMALVNLDTDEPAVSDVIKTHDVFEGDQLDALPDLMVVWNRTHPIRRLGSPKLKQISQPYPDVRTGDHTTNVLFMVRGPGIAEGRIADQPPVQDFTQTIASYLGTEISDIDGRTVDALLPPDRRSRARARTS